MRLVPGSGVVTGRKGFIPRRPWRLAAAVAAGGLLIAGCRVPFASSAGAPAVSATLTVVAGPGIADAPLYIGVHDGLFRSAGLTVKIMKAATFQDEIKALQGGQAQIAFGDYADIFYTHQILSSQHVHHAPAGLALIADGYDAVPSVMQVLTLPTSGIVSPRDLVGKTVGTTQPQVMPDNVLGRPYSLETVATQSVLSDNNVDPTKVRWMPLPSRDLVSALASKKVDAILATEPAIYEAESKYGAVPVLDSCSGETENLPLDGYFSLRAYASDHPATVSVFKAALARAQSAASQAQPTQMALQQYAGLNPQAAALVTIGDYPTSMRAPNLQRIVTLMFSFGALLGPVHVSNMITP